ncbi:hypothetical protein [Paenibacillus graminis]|uniref:hypothetical protein n=1 Tax=Paenibacillus graminis TaxID=189425 RepID=UPI0012DD6EC7|nr:hypothetical protein [Paenibacillus graminis]
MVRKKRVLYFLLALALIVFPFSNKVTADSSVTSDVYSYIEVPGIVDKIPDNHQIRLNTQAIQAYPSCNKNGWTYGDTGSTRFTSQQSFSGGLQWGFEVTPSGYAILGSPPTITVSMAGASVTKSSGITRTLYPGSLYSPHTYGYPATYHGSITNYNYIGSTAPAYFESGDLLGLTFNFVGSTGGSGTAFVYCEYQ